MRLTMPTAEYEPSFLEYCAEYNQNGVGGILLTEWVSGVPEGLAPATQHWLVEGNRVIGVGNLRHNLTPALEIISGHISYSVKLGLWNRGVATAFLKLLLAQAAERGIRWALLTCDAENAASLRVMEKNGGRRIDTVAPLIGGKRRATHRVLIDTGFVPSRKNMFTPNSFAREISGGQLTLLLHRVEDEGGRIYSCYFDILSGIKKVGWIVYRFADEPVLYYDGNIGYFVTPEYRGRGIAARACRLLAGYVRNMEIGIGAPEIFITADSRNKASRRICESIGAVFLEIVQTDKKRMLCRYAVK